MTRFALGDKAEVALHVLRFGEAHTRRLLVTVEPRTNIVDTFLSPFTNFLRSWDYRPVTSWFEHFVTINWNSGDAEVRSTSSARSAATASNSPEFSKRSTCSSRSSTSAGSRRSSNGSSFGSRIFGVSEASRERVLVAVRPGVAADARRDAPPRRRRSIVVPRMAGSYGHDRFRERRATMARKLCG